MKGLLPLLRSRVQFLLPENLTSAVAKALQAEHEIAIKESGKIKRHVDSMNLLQSYDENSIEEFPTDSAAAAKTEPTYH